MNRGVVLFWQSKHTPIPCEPQVGVLGQGWAPYQFLSQSDVGSAICLTSCCLFFKDYDAIIIIEGQFGCQIISVSVQLSNGRN